MAELVKSKTQLVCEIIVAVLLAAFVVYAPGLVGTLIPADSQLAPMIPVLVGVVYVLAYEFLSVEGLEVFKEALEKLRAKKTDMAGVTPIAYFLVAFLAVLVAAGIMLVCVYHADLAATLAGVFAVVVGVLALLKNKLFPVVGEDTVTYNGITFTRRPGDPRGVYFNEERKAVYVVWRGHDLKTVIASPPFSGYLVYTKNGEQRDCVYADGVLYATRADPLEEGPTKLEMLARIDGMGGREAVEWVVATLAGRGEDADLLKLGLVWPNTYREAAEKMKQAGEWPDFVSGKLSPGLPTLWSNYLSNTLPEFQKRDAQRLVEAYYKENMM